MKYWYLHGPSLLLVAMIYLLLARALLAAAAGWSAQGMAARLLQGLTDPILSAVRTITPGAVPRGGVLVLALVWLFAILCAFVYGLAIAGTRPLWT